MEVALSVIRFLVIFTLLFVFIKPIFYFIGLFAGLIGSVLNLFSYLGASCNTIATVSGLITTFILGGLLIKIYWIFHHSD